MWIEVRCRLVLEPSVATPLILLLRPSSDPYQWVAREHYRITPEVSVEEYVDGFCNRCQRLVAPPGEFVIDTGLEARVAGAAETRPGAPWVPVERLPARTLLYLMPSRFCESDLMGALAADIVRDVAPGYDQVAAIVAWIRAELAYRPASDPLPVSAMAIRERGIGVCRDFAHLGIALCRSLNIPARLVAGYLEGLEPMDLHAWFEAYVGGRWYTFDATRTHLDGGRVAVARGRDAADVPVFNCFGPPVIPREMSVRVERLAD